MLGDGEVQVKATRRVLQARSDLRGEPPRPLQDHSLFFSITKIHFPSILTFESCVYHSISQCHLRHTLMTHA